MTDITSSVGDPLTVINGHETPAAIQSIGSVVPARQGGSGPAYLPGPDGRYHCPECEFSSHTPNAIGSHRFRKHADPETTAAFRAKLSASQLGRKRKPATDDKPHVGRVRAPMMLPELEAIVSAMPPGDPVRTRLLHRRSEAVRHGRDVLAWERRKLAELTGGKVTSTAIATTVRAVDPAREAERRERAERAAADKLFETVAGITDTLFPDRVPSTRILEVAQWQTDTLRMMTR